MKALNQYTTKELFTELARRYTADAMDVYLDADDEVQPARLVREALHAELSADCDRVSENGAFSVVSTIALETLREALGEE